MSTGINIAGQPTLVNGINGLSQGRLGDIIEHVIIETNILDLQIAINSYYVANPGAYLVSRSIIHNGTEYVALLTVNLL